jgi:glycosyltransferase involved in cell wall biosynthesis
MRVLILSKALVVGPYQRKAEELAALPDIDLTVAVPPSWREPGALEQKLERRFVRGYRLAELPIWFNGRHHEHFYPAIARLVAAVRPDVFHIDEESFNFATFHAMRAGVQAGARCCFYNWANIERRYPPPYGWFERYNFRHAAHAIAGNAEAAAIIRNHGYAGPVTVLPQFGVDPALFAPRPDEEKGSQFSVPGSRFVVGYLGRLLPQKGVLDLVEALAQTPERVQLRIIGTGAQRAELLARAEALGVQARVELEEWTDDVPAALRGLDALALPSRTTRAWKEQFGRVLIEAMSCAVPVLGSSSGEIPNVVGDGGLIFPEGDVPALAKAIEQLAASPALCAEIGARGRARVLAHYTQAALARQYAEVYRAMRG